MTEKRHLSAIVFSDIVGYSRMMGADENRALRILAEHNEIVPAIIEANDGRVLKFIGDAVLASFDSASEAVKAATDIQNKLSARNQEKPPEEQLLVRIGIHIGDVVLRDGDVFGDGVNIAARIEPLAEPGGICISQTVYDMVRARPEIRTVNLGPRELKNISDKIQIYKVLVEAEEEGADFSGATGSPAASAGSTAGSPPAAGSPAGKTSGAVPGWMIGVGLGVLIALLLVGVVQLVAPGGVRGLLFGNNLVIHSQPSGAEVFEKGVSDPVGTTPYYDSRDEGRYLFTVKLEDHYPESLQMEVSGEAAVEKQITLLPEKNVALDSTPQGAKVTVAGVPVCETTPCRFRLDRGTHRIVVKKDNLVGKKSLWVGKTGQPKEVTVKLAKPAKRPKGGAPMPRLCSEVFNGVRVYRPCP